MTHDELLAKIDEELATDYEDSCGNVFIGLKALRAVVELHRPTEARLCEWCTCMDCEHSVEYPCKTIQKIEKELA
jgi:hypothetical protein